MGESPSRAQKYFQQAQKHAERYLSVTRATRTLFSPGAGRQLSVTRVTGGGDDFSIFHPPRARAKPVSAPSVTAW